MRFTAPACVAIAWIALLPVLISAQYGTPPPLCQRCGPGSNGPCQNIYAACWEYQADGTCPAATYECTCPLCTVGTSGPCHYTDGRCGPYADGTEMCPVGSFECYVDTPNAPTPSRSNSPSPTISVTSTVSGTASPTPSPSQSNVPRCRKCSVGSSGKCQTETGICFDLFITDVSASSSPSPTKGTSYFGYIFEAGSCPAGSVQCVCPACEKGTSGPCHLPDNTCVPFQAGTSICPFQAFECWKDTDSAPSFTATVTPRPSRSPSRSLSNSPTSVPSVTATSSVTATESATPTRSPSHGVEAIVFAAPAQQLTLGVAGSVIISFIATLAAFFGMLFLFKWHKRRQLEQQREGTGSDDVEAAFTPKLPRSPRKNQIAPFGAGNGQPTDGSSGKRDGKSVGKRHQLVDKHGRLIVSGESAHNLLASASPVGHGAQMLDYNTALAVLNAPLPDEGSNVKLAMDHTGEIRVLTDEEAAALQERPKAPKTHYPIAARAPEAVVSQQYDSSKDATAGVRAAEHATSSNKELRLTPQLLHRQELRDASVAVSELDDDDDHHSLHEYLKMMQSVQRQHP